MGVCSCKDSKPDFCVEVEKLDVPKILSPMASPKKYLKVKSIRISNPEQFQSYTKVSELLEQNDCEKMISASIKLTEPNKLVTEHEINDLEEGAIKKALYGHFLFKDMNDEIL
jgi:hypothetical protein